MRFSPAGSGCSNCCPTGCVIDEDDFDRADSSNLGSDWTEVAGDWEIASNELSISAAANAIATHNTPWPGGDVYFAVWTEVTVATTGDEARVICAYTDQNDYVYAVYSPVDASCGVLELWEVVGTLHTKLAEAQLDGAVAGVAATLQVCYVSNASVIHAYARLKLDNFRYVVVDDEATAQSGLYSGVGTKTCSGTVTFDDFKFYSSDYDAGCDYCPACTRFVDEFNRSDSDTLGCDWSEDEGDADIASNKAVFDCSSDQDHQISITLPLPSGIGVAFLGCTWLHIYNPYSYPPLVYSLPPTVIFMIDHVDSSNYHYAKAAPVLVGLSYSHQLSIGKVSGGVDTTLAIGGYAGIASSAMKVGLYDGKLCGSLYGMTVSAETTAHNGNTAAIRIEDCDTTFHTTYPPQIDGVWVGVDTNPLYLDACDECWPTCFPCAPAQEASSYTVALSGWGNSWCTIDCSDINTSWVCSPSSVPLQLRGSLTTCVYESAEMEFSCASGITGSAMVLVYVPAWNFVLGQYNQRVMVRVLFNTGSGWWGYSLVTDPLGFDVDCSQIGSGTPEDLTLVDSYAYAACSAGTATIVGS